MASGTRSASDSRLGVAECEAGVPGAEKSGEGDGDGDVRSDELSDAKSTTSPLSSVKERPVGLSGTDEAASLCARRISLASCVRDRFSFSRMALSTALRPPRFRSPSTVMVGSGGGFDVAGIK